jgi:arylsulfatase A-like enzyme/Tfp pilus assembly protein PilF
VVAVTLAAVALVRSRPAPVRRDPGLSVLLVSIDTLRADALGCYGRADAGTRWIDRLAAGGVRFETARAHNVVTLPSHANLLSGRLPVAHGVRDNSGFRFPAETPTLATLLHGAGWRTGAFVSAFVMDSRFGLDRGFEVYDDRLGGAETRAAFVVPERPGPETVAAAAGWIRSLRGSRFFAFVHLYEPHFPYTPPAPQAARYATAPYRGEVAAADEALGPLLGPILEDAGGRVLVVLTSDHGESLGEHGEATHGLFAYDATLRVPLVLYAPRILRPAVVRTPVRHVDVLPTVLDALGLDAPPGLPGRSLLGLVDGGEAGGDDSYLEALSSSLNRGWAPLRGVVSGSLKYIDLPIPELYDLRADPGEASNLAATHPKELDRLRARLTRLREGETGASTRVGEDRAALEALRALGYVSGGDAPRKASYGEEDDPKRLVALDALASDVVMRYQLGDVEGAVALCQRLVAERPDMPLAWLQLAFLERARGRLDAAIGAGRKAVALRPADAESASLLGAYLTEAGRGAEAAALLERYAERSPSDLDVLTALGMAQASLGRTAEALATFARAREADPTSALTLANAGTAHLMAGDRAAARQAFAAALDLDDSLARAHNGLGVIAAQEGRTDEAIARWQRAAALDPRDYQTLFNLGAALRGQGRAHEARPYLEAYLRAAPVALEARDMERVRGWLAAGTAP